MKITHTYKCLKCANEWVSRVCKLSTTIEESERKQSGSIPTLKPICPFEDAIGPANFILTKKVIQ